MDTLKIFHVEDGEDWWLVAIDEADALEIAKTMDIGVDENFEELSITELPMDKQLTVDLSCCGYHPDERDIYPAEPYKDAYDRWKVTATVAEWLMVHKRGDCVASSMF